MAASIATGLNPDKVIALANSLGRQGLPARGFDVATRSCPEVAGLAVDRFLLRIHPRVRPH
jgi:hypothetical protein